MLHSSSRLLRQGPSLLPAVSRHARLLIVAAKAKQDKGGKKEAGGKQQPQIPVSRLHTRMHSSIKQH